MKMLLILAALVLPALPVGGEEACSLDFAVTGQEAADLAAKHLGVPVRLRRHPRHSLRVEFLPGQESYGLREGGR